MAWEAEVSCTSLEQGYLWPLGPVGMEGWSSVYDLNVTIKTSEESKT